MRIPVIFSAGAVAILATLWSTPVQAQPIGTFTWQLQPFCNRVTVSVTQNGGVYTLDGFDDQCGAAQRAPLVGLATPNPDGTIGFGLHIVTVPGGLAVQVDARITLAALGGPWSDSAGNSGTFVLNGAAAGAARPAPTVSGAVLAVGSVPAAAIANGAITSTQIANNTITSANTQNEPGVSSAFSGTSTSLTGTATSVVNTSMRVPANGFVKVEVSGNWGFGAAGLDGAICQIQKGAATAIDPGQPRVFLRRGEDVSDGNLHHFSAHRVIAANVADNPPLITSGQAFRLVCELTSGTASVDELFISATYFASSYEPISFIVIDPTPPQQ